MFLGVNLSALSARGDLFVGTTKLDHIGCNYKFAAVVTIGDVWASGCRGESKAGA
jgi:hypothetical protein